MLVLAVVLVLVHRGMRLRVVGARVAAVVRLGGHGVVDAEAAEVDGLSEGDAGHGGVPQVYVGIFFRDLVSVSDTRTSLRVLVGGKGWSRGDD